MGPSPNETGSQPRKPRQNRDAHVSGGVTAAIPTAELREGSGHGMMTRVEDQGGRGEITATLKRREAKAKKDDRFHNNYRDDNGWTRMVV